MANNILAKNKKKIVAGKIKFIRVEKLPKAIAETVMKVTECQGSHNKF